MGFIIKWTVVVAILWLVAVVGIQVLAVFYPQYRDSLLAVSGNIEAVGGAVGNFLAPVLQLALVIVILLAAGERLGLLGGGRSNDALGRLTSAANVQAFIAVVI